MEASLHALQQQAEEAHRANEADHPVCIMGGLQPVQTEEEDGSMSHYRCDWHHIFALLTPVLFTTSSALPFVAGFRCTYICLLVQAAVRIVCKTLNGLVHSPAICSVTAGTSACIMNDDYELICPSFIMHADIGIKVSRFASILIVPARSACVTP